MKMNRKKKKTMKIRNASLRNIEKKETSKKKKHNWIWYTEYKQRAINSSSLARPLFVLASLT